MIETQSLAQFDYKSKDYKDAIERLTYSGQIKEVKNNRAVDFIIVDGSCTHTTPYRYIPACNPMTGCYAGRGGINAVNPSPIPK